MNAVDVYEEASWDLEHSKITLGEFEERIKLLYDVEPVRHGHWVDNTHYCGWTCSECGDHDGAKTDNYCHNCGAKMDEEQEHE